ncbi:MAG: adenylate kinase [Bacteroidales bacterium]|nr:adenylate kinase [Bacteroidales bacterium]
MSTQQCNIVLLGAPGSGKGTQAPKLMEKFGLYHISTGDMFRKEIASQSPIGLKAKSIIERGELCPDDVTLDMLNSFLSKLGECKGYILDGVPRTLEQAHMMDGINYDKPISISKVIYIKIEEEEIIKRILKRAAELGRTDDTPEVAKNRTAQYFKLTHPLIEYYQKQGKLIEINGMQTIDKVFADICKALDS